MRDGSMAQRPNTDHDYTEDQRCEARCPACGRPGLSSGATATATPRPASPYSWSYPHTGRVFHDYKDGEGRRVIDEQDRP